MTHAVAADRQASLLLSLEVSQTEHWGALLRLIMIPTELVASYCGHDWILMVVMIGYIHHRFCTETTIGKKCKGEFCRLQWFGFRDSRCCVPRLFTLISCCAIQPNIKDPHRSLSAPERWEFAQHYGHLWVTHAICYTSASRGSYQTPTPK